MGICLTWKSIPAQMLDLNTPNPDPKGIKVTDLTYICTVLEHKCEPLTDLYKIL